MTFSRSRQQTSRKLVEFLSQWMNCARGEKLAVLLAHNALQWRRKSAFLVCLTLPPVGLPTKGRGRADFCRTDTKTPKWLWKSSPLAFLPLLPPLRSRPPRRVGRGKGSGCDLNAFLSWNKATFWLFKSINWIWIYRQSGWKLFCREIIGAIETVGSLDGDTLKEGPCKNINWTWIDTRVSENIFQL